MLVSGQQGNIKNVLSQNFGALSFREHCMCVSFSFDTIKLAIGSASREKPLSAGTFHRHDVPHSQEETAVFLLLDEKDFCITTQGHPCYYLDPLIPCSINKELR